MRQLVFVAVLVAALAGAAAAAGAPANHPCALLTDQQVASAFASKVVGHTAQSVGLAPSCTWTGTPLTTGPGQASAQLTVIREPERIFVKANRQPGIAEVRDIGGTAAAWFSTIDQLTAWQDGYSVSVTVQGPYVTAPLAADKALVRDVFKRL